MILEPGVIGAAVRHAEKSQLTIVCNAFSYGHEHRAISAAFWE